MSVEVTRCMLSPSLIAARSIVSSSFVHDLRSRILIVSDPKPSKSGRKVMKSTQENRCESNTTFCKEKECRGHNVVERLCEDQKSDELSDRRSESRDCTGKVNIMVPLSWTVAVYYY